MLGRYGERFRASEQRCDSGRFLQSGLLLDCALIDIGGRNHKRNACCG